MKSMRRALRCDGLIPARMNSAGQFVDLQPEDVCATKAYVDANRAPDTPFDIVVEGKTIGLDRIQMRDKLCPWREAGATWWIESLVGLPQEEIVARLRQGPPRLD